MRSFLCWGPDPSNGNFRAFQFLPMRRRSELDPPGVLQGGGAGFVSALALFMIGAGRTAHADPLAAVPTVDRLTVRMVVDNGLTPFTPPGPLDGLEVKRAGLDTATDRPPRRALEAESGLAMAQSGAATKRECYHRFRIYARDAARRSVDPWRRSGSHRRPGVQPRPFRPLRRDDRLSDGLQGSTEERPAAVPWRQGLLLRSRGAGRQQIRRARPGRDR